jgi:hypothetical protein
MTIIPKIAFTFWEGNQFTYLHALTIKTFQKHNPDFRIIIYISYKKDENVVMWSSSEQKKKYNNLYDINLLKNIPNVEFIEVDLNKILSYDGVLSSVWKSDIIRLLKLYEHGGMYIDFDILFIKKVPESLFNIDKIMFNTYENIINNAVIIANKRNNILKILIYEILKIITSNNIKDSYMQFGPVLITRIVYNNKNLEKDVYYIPNDMTCPYLWNEMDKLFLTNIDQITKDTFCIHWYNGSLPSRNYCSNFDIKKINKNNNIFEKILIESYLNTDLEQLEIIYKEYIIDNETDLLKLQNNMVLTNENIHLKVIKKNYNNNIHTFIKCMKKGYFYKNSGIKIQNKIKISII